MKDKNSIANTIKVATGVCLVAAVIVSTAAVTLRPHQEENRNAFRQLNVLQAAGMYEPGMDVGSAFERIERRFIEFSSGEYVELDSSFDPIRAARDPARSRTLDEDPAGIGRQARYGEVFLARNADGELTRVIFPVHGYGLWSTMYGFIALEPDLNTIAGISFFEHGETPGLGGEIENPSWQDNWIGTRLRNEQDELVFRVDRGRTPEGVPDADYRIDGLSGATITANGVQAMVRFWFGEQGYAPYLRRLSQQTNNDEVLI